MGIVRRRSFERYLEAPHLAADMGGAGYIFTGEHDADVMHNSATINLNCLHFGMKAGVRKFFNSSSACMYGIEILGDGEQTWRNSDTRLIRGQLN